MTQDTNATGGAAIKRYKIGYHTDEWGVRSSTPGGITDPSGQWVLYKDHLAALASHGPAPAQAAPAAVAVPSGLRTRCEEILAWRKTGVLPGEALRTIAREKYGDEYDAIQRAERDTETEALNFVIATPTPQPAPQQEPGKAVHQFRKQHCADWYDGRADHSDGRGPYEERTLYTSPQQEAQEQAAVPRFNCWTTNDGDSWFDHPADSQAIYDCLGNDAKVGDEYELTAGWRSVTARYRITEVVGDGEEYEVECISHQQENTAPSPSPASQGDALDAARYRWLREQPFDTWKRIAWNTWDNDPVVWPDRDAAIDAARAAQEGK